MLIEHIYSQQNELFDALYNFCVQALQKDLSEHKQASILLSGGSTPAPFYERLAQEKLDWQNLHPALVDERWLTVTDKGSNEGMLRLIFKNNRIFLDHLIGMYTNDFSFEDAVPVCNKRYQDLPNPISFCLLGMGLDGHTASLFPNAQGLKEALQTSAPCHAIKAHESTVTGKNVQRMTLSLNGILRAQRILLLITGKEKWQVFQQALKNEDSVQMPISAVLHQAQRDIHIFYSP